ncbi:MAG TPA: DeoR/GlpR family DNA-binding transcription regulator [Candidatus Methylomirabilis sp.]|nr:DeoR/GlpR family DNA-binding transcription regulator [Candidatus Methylomirabilis sp.]
MHPLVRQQKILGLLEGHGVVSVGKLARSTRASEMTVRRDLSLLRDRGLVRKVHGGAVLEVRKAEESHFSATRQEHVDEKRAIAKEAATLVSPGSVVALGAGTTTWHVARALADRTDLTFITNSTNIALELDRGHSNIILVGGHFRTPGDALVGPPALWTLERLQIDLLFLGANGVDLKAGYTTPVLAEVEVNLAMIRKASRVVLVADHTKFARVTLASFGRIEAAHVLITDPAAPRPLLQAIRRRGVEVMVAGKRGR